jgi:hypothetical protein
VSPCRIAILVAGGELSGGTWPDEKTSTMLTRSSAWGQMKKTIALDDATSVALVSLPVPRMATSFRILRQCWRTVRMRSYSCPRARYSRGMIL